MTIKCALLGPPNSGKTSLFNLLTKNNAETSKFPFSTIRPNRGHFELENAIIELIDLPSLTENSDEGEGLGNTFLSYVLDVDIISIVSSSKEEALMIKKEILKYDLNSLGDNPKYAQIKRDLLSGINVNPKEIDKKLLFFRPVIITENDHFVANLKNEIKTFFTICKNNKKRWNYIGELTLQEAASKVHKEIANNLFGAKINDTYTDNIYHRIKDGDILDFNFQEGPHQK